MEGLIYGGAYFRNFTVVLVARIRLLWILGFLIQLRGRRHRRRFHPYWIFPRPAESWFEIHDRDHQRHFRETLFRRNMRMGRELFDYLLRLLRGYVQRENTRFRDCIPPEKVLASSSIKMAGSHTVTFAL